MKQTQGSLLSEKQLLIKQLQQVNTSIEPYKSKITRGEEQVSLHCYQPNICFSFVQTVSVQELLKIRNETDESMHGTSH